MCKRCKRQLYKNEIGYCYEGHLYCQVCSIISNRYYEEIITK